FSAGAGLIWKRWCYYLGFVGLVNCVKVAAGECVSDATRMESPYHLDWSLWLLSSSPALSASNINSERMVLFLAKDNETIVHKKIRKQLQDFFYSPPVVIKNCYRPSVFIQPYLKERALVPTAQSLNFIFNLRWGSLSLTWAISSLVRRALI
ncbi:hypothetical protein BGW39_011173, partial [Mortierella sp. 14UC]